MATLQDPVGTSFLGNASAEQFYQRKISALYDRAARRPDSAFSWLEAFEHLSGGGQASDIAVRWPAYPLLQTVPESQIDRDRTRRQEEYVEWRVEISQSRVQRITFTTEFPEYFEASAEVDTASLVAAIQDAIPGSNPTPLELYGANLNADALPGLARANMFRNNLPRNPWNNGQKGILCLTHGANTLGALFGLLTECGVLNSSGDENETCGLTGGACVPGRNSDPRVCARAQSAVRGQLAFTLKDPCGIRILELAGSWKFNGSDFDINDLATNHGIWKIDRNRRRGTLNLPAGVTLDGSPISTGAQVARKLFVDAVLLVAPDASLPQWARTGNEGSRGGGGPF